MENDAPVLLILIKNISLCFAGLSFYMLFVARNHLGNFNRGVFWKENKTFIIWAGIVQLCYAVLMAFFPVLENLISQRLIAVLDAASGQDLNIPPNLANIVVYLTLTWQLSRWVNKGVSKENKMGTKKE